MTETSDRIGDAARAIRAGKLVVYPTETVYGLGADALSVAAVERMFSAKGRDRSKPVSMAVPDIETAGEYTVLSTRERAFMEAFLPGPITVVVERQAEVPDALTAGRDRVGIRIPAEETALTLLGQVSPVTATSANVSGQPSARRAESLDETIRRAAAIVLGGGETPGGGSTVVDVERGEIHRRGKLAGEVESWLTEQ